MRSLVTLFLRVNKKVNKVNIVTFDSDSVLALHHLTAFRKKTYTCVCCRKRVSAVGTYTDEHHASLTVSRLCFDCYFWLSKVGQGFIIINGYSYSFREAGVHVCRNCGEEEPAAHFFDRCVAGTAEQVRKMKLSSSHYVVCMNGEYIVYKDRPFEQGQISEATRPWLPDNAKWICPICAEPFHTAPGSGYGFICMGCRQLVARTERW